MDPRRVGDVPRAWMSRYDAPLPAHCPDCAGPVVQTGVVQQYQEELPVTRVVVRQFDVHVGRVPQELIPGSATQRLVLKDQSGSSRMPRNESDVQASGCRVDFCLTSP